MRPTILSFLPLFIASGAAAQWEPAAEKRLSAAYNDCQGSGDAARGVTSAMMECLGGENDRQDARLNQAYRMTMNRLPAGRKAALRQSQRAWIARRDAAAKKAGEASGGGSAAGLEYSSTILHETIRRIIWLEKYR